LKKSYLKYAILIIVPLLVFSVLLVSSSDDYPTDSRHMKYVSSVNEFGIKLIKKLTENGSDNNVFISPTSLLLALTMANDGAAGSTMDSIQTALNLQSFSKNEINTFNSELLTSLMSSDASVELNIANSIWLNQRKKFKSVFIDDCETYYNADTFIRNFSHPNTLLEINSWVSDKTNGKINSIASRLNPEEILVILNAIYFYGRWSFPFEYDDTKDRTFYLIDGNKKVYPRMTQKGTFEYLEDSTSQAINLPYGERFSMYIILPRERNGLPKLLDSLSNDNVYSMINKMGKQKGVISLPKFKVEYSASFVNILKKFGMSIAFNEGANFDMMAESPVFISNVLQKTYLNVAEKGTEAAAVTAVIMTTGISTNPNPEKLFYMIIDHPFLCLIKDNISGVILFSGAIYDPKPIN
jgi:serine protease inhibitor